MIFAAHRRAAFLKGSNNMIVNPSALPTLQFGWHGVIRMRDRVRNLVMSTFAVDTAQSPTFGDILYNLPLVLAFDVLTQALLLAREAGQFTSPRLQLDDLMDNAKTALPWVDWQCLRDGVKLRYEVAGAGRLFGDIQCLRYIAHVEKQLIAWNIISSAEQPVLVSVTSHR